MSQSFLKDPDSQLDYTISWLSWLNGDTIATSSWAAESGITIEDESNTTTTATVWLSGGTLGEVYLATNTIVTAGGRTDERSITLRVTEK